MEVERAIPLEGCLCYSSIVPAAPTISISAHSVKTQTIQRCKKYVCKLGPNARIRSPARGSTNRHCPMVQTSPLYHAHQLHNGNDTRRLCQSTYTVPARRRADTYRKNSSFHSISPAALPLPPVIGLVHFCCGGLSSSATQRISPTPATERQRAYVHLSTRGLSGTCSFFPFKPTQNIHSLQSRHLHACPCGSAMFSHLPAFPWQPKFSTRRFRSNSLEPRGAAATPDGDSRVNLLLGT